MGVAKNAGIMAAKKTSEVIPLYHPLPITHCKIDFEMLAEESAVEVSATIKVDGKTGVEMEALHTVSVTF